MSSPVLTGLFETMRVYRGTLPLLARHLARLNAACEYVNLLKPPPDIATEAEGHGLRPPADRVVRIQWNGGSIVWDDRDLPAVGAIRLATVEEPHTGYPVKSVDRAMFERAAAEAGNKGADEPLLCTEEGWVAESPRFAVAWLEGDAVCLPALDLDILPSVGRARLIDLAADAGLDVREVRCAPEALDGKPLVLVNAVQGVCEVAALNGVPVPSDVRTRGLADRFWPAG